MTLPSLLSHVSAARRFVLRALAIRLLAIRLLAVRTLALSLASLASLSASAQATRWCDGKIDSYYLQADGDLAVLPSWRNDWVHICNIHNPRAVNGPSISTQMCRSWLAMLTQAHAQSRQTIIQYGSAPECSQMPLYQLSPSPTYFMVRQ